MKKITKVISTITIALLPFNFAFGQSMADSRDNQMQGSSMYANQGFFAGVRATPQLSWMVNKDDNNISGYKTLSRFGASFGAAGGYIFNNHIGAELNVLYSLEGGRYKVSDQEYTQKMEYLKIPLLFTYTTKPSTFMFLGKVGPQLNILSAAKVSPAIVNGVTISNNKDQFENVVFGGVASAGVRYTATNDLWLDASVRYDINFTNVENKSYKYYPDGRANTYNMTAGLEIGFNYLF